MKRYLPICRLCFLAAAGVFKTGCEPQVSVTEWTPIAYDEILSNMESPTGQLIEDDPTKTVIEVERFLSDGQRIARVAEIADMMYRQFETILHAVENSDGGAANGGDAHTGSGEVKGTRAFLRLACIGASASTPSRDFSDGYLYLEGPTFAAKDALQGEVALDGDLFGEFREDCLVGDAHVTGSFPGYISDLTDRLMVDFDVVLTRNSGENERVRFPLLLLGKAVKILLRTQAEGNYVLGFEAGNTVTFELGTAAGFYRCSIGSSGYACDLIPI